MVAGCVVFSQYVTAGTKQPHLGAAERWQQVELVKYNGRWRKWGAGAPASLSGFSWRIIIAGQWCELTAANRLASSLATGSWNRRTAGMAGARLYQAAVVMSAGAR